MANDRKDPTAHNFYRVFTWVCDYCIMAFALYAADRTFTNEELPGRSAEKLTLLRNFLYVVGFIVLLDVRDIVYMCFFPSTIISKYKTQGHPLRPIHDIFLSSIKASVILAAVMSNLTFLGAVFWSPVFVDSFAVTATTIGWRIVEGYALWVFKDITSMYFLHALMHTPKWYSMHKYHHSITKEMSQAYGGYFDVLDIMLENAFGVLILLPLRYLLYGDASFHMMSYIVVFWLDFTSHSANPYTATFLNPILDYLMRPNVVHNLHHAVINDYFTLIPFYHISPARRKADLEVYNSKFETEIDVY